MFKFTPSYIMYIASDQGLRSGQVLYNQLPGLIAEKVVGTSFDPFYRDMSHHEIQEWIDNHLIFNENGDIIAVFHGDNLLREITPPSSKETQPS